MTLAAAVAVVILSLTAGIWVSTGEANRARQEQHVADQQRSIAEVQRRIAQVQEASAIRARDQTTVQRSREVIDEPRIEKVNLTTGPMAITGSPVDS